MESSLWSPGGRLAGSLGKVKVKVKVTVQIYRCCIIYCIIFISERYTSVFLEILTNMVVVL